MIRGGRPAAIGLALALLLPLPAAGQEATPSAAPAPSASAAPAPIDPARLPAGFERYLELLAIVREHYVGADGLDDAALVEGSIRGLVSALGDDGHTTWLSPEEVAAEDASLRGEVSGIGVLVDDRSGVPVIVSVIPGSPAEAAGVRTGDRILAVDGKRTDRMGEGELVGAVRGEPGTTVTLLLERPDGRRRSLPVERALIAVPSAEHALIPGTGIGVIRLLQFDSGAAEEVADALRALRRQGAEAFVLDLRGNPGGLLDEAVGVASLFLADGTVYRERSRDGSVREVPARGDAVEAEAPLVVLVDAGSASSAEIVAAALGESGRAVTVGETTFGTGTILGFFGLSDGSAIRLGTQRWETPSGRDLYAEGLTPETVVERAPAGRTIGPSELARRGPQGLRGAGDPQIVRALRILREALRERGSTGGAPRTLRVVAPARLSDVPVERTAEGPARL